MAGVHARSRSDRGQMVSPWFRQRLASLLIFSGLIVLAVVCLTFGPLGIGVGVVLLVGMGPLLHAHRRRPWSERGHMPEARAGQ